MARQGLLNMINWKIIWNLALCQEISLIIELFLPAATQHFMNQGYRQHFFNNYFKTYCLQNFYKISQSRASGSNSFSSPVGDSLGDSDLQYLWSTSVLFYKQMTKRLPQFLVMLRNYFLNLKHQFKHLLQICLFCYWVTDCSSSAAVDLHTACSLQ